MIATVKRIFGLLSESERRKLYWLVPFVTALSFMEVAGITSIAPFLLLLADPSNLDTNRFLNAVYVNLGFSSHQTFLVFTGVVAALFFGVSNAFSMLTTWLLLRFSWRSHHELSKRLLSNYLHSSYETHLQRNTVDLSTNLLAEVQQAIMALLLPAVQLIASASVALFIVVLLVIVNPVLAVVTSCVLGVAYVGVYSLVRRTLARIGKERVAAEKSRHRTVAEALKSSLEITLQGKEQAFIDRFTIFSESYARHRATYDAIEVLPRYVLEAIAFGSVLIVILVLLLTGQDVTGLLPTLGVFTFASYRLLPSLQRIFRSTSAIRFNTATLDLLLEAVKTEHVRPTVDRSQVAPLSFSKELVLEDISFMYPMSEERVLDGLDLRVAAGTSVAFVGKTGSGKSTAADLILGLLRPTAGRLLVDGRAIDESNMANWQMNLGYIPQNIQLHDDTIVRNIAFGVPDELINQSAVERAAKYAQLHDFIMNDLPEQYLTVIGEQGIRLSGGQRQRLGIARALYADPPVLVLDEATSALDSATENDVMLAIKDLAKMKTVIIIAHRLSTVIQCDKLLLFEAGRIVARGSYEELALNSSLFRTLSQALTEAQGGTQVLA